MNGQSGGMCGRYSFFDTDKLYERFQVTRGSEALESRYNVAPGQLMPVILDDPTRHVEVMKWGLVPYWARDEKIGYKMINARAETVMERPAFREPFRNKRCLVPVSGFFEWQGEGKKKQPYYIHLAKEPIFALAGLYDEWHGKEEPLRTYTIITVDANESLKSIHNRMPAILEREQEKQWLDLDNDDYRGLLAMLTPFPSAFMKLHPVSRAVNAAKVESPDVIKPSV